MTEKEWEKWKATPEGGCLVTMVMWTIVIVFALVCAMIFGSCKTKYVAVPEYHTVLVEKHDTTHTRDSIYQRDSVYMWMQGDTIWKEKYQVLYKDRWREKIVYRDSVKIDSVRVPYPVEKPVSKWQKAKDSALLVLLAMVAALVALVKFRKP